MKGDNDMNLEERIAKAIAENSCPHTTDASDKTDRTSTSFKPSTEITLLLQQLVSSPS